MTRSRESGMATAEYSVATLGAVLFAVVLFKLGLEDSWFVDQLRDIIERALRPGILLERLGNLPRLGFR